MISILALDLGTTMGWATGGGALDSLHDCGALLLGSAKEVAANRKARMDRRLDPRIPRLYRWLEMKYEAAAFDWIAFEDVEFATSRMQAQLWSSYRATVWLFASQRHIQVECCPVATLKKFGCGHGGATKDMMAAGLVRKDMRFLTVNGKVNFVGHESNFFLTDDGVDAVHLLKWAQSVLRNLEPKTP